MKTLLFLALVLFSFSSTAQPEIQWQKCLGGSGAESAISSRSTSDGGYVVAGTTNSTDDDVSGNHGANDAWLVKLDALGAIQWQQCIGGSEWEVFGSIIQTNDGGYAALGYAGSSNGNVSGFHGGFYDLWVVKTDSNGALQWQKCLGGSQWDGLSDWSDNSIEETNDGGYILAGYTQSNDGDVVGHHGGSDGWVVKLNANGSIEWQKCLGGTGSEFLTSIHQDSDGGYILCGTTNSMDGDVSGIHEGTALTGSLLIATSDCWVVKLDYSGDILWQKCYGGFLSESAVDIQPTTGGGWVVAAHSVSTDGDVSGYHAGFDASATDSWILNLDSNGDIIWQNCFGGSGFDYSMTLQQADDGGFVIFGQTASNDGDVSGNHLGLDGFSYFADFWIYKLSPDGILEWQKCLGSSGNDGCYSGRQTPDGGFMLVGDSNQNDGDVSGNHSNGSNAMADIWIVKLAPLDPAASIHNSITRPIAVFPNPTDDYIAFTLDNKLVGTNYRLMDMPGREVMSGKISSIQTTLSLQQLPSGTYTLKIENVEPVKVVKR